MEQSRKLLPAVGFFVASILFVSYFNAQTRKVEIPAIRINLSSQGLPDGFFNEDADTKCSGQIIQYRFVTWLSNEEVAVGFNTSPNCRQTPNHMVDGVVRLLVFDVYGNLKASRNLPYLADGNGEMVGEGEAMTGPGGTLLFRKQSVNLDKEGTHESKSSVLLLDARLKEVKQFESFLEQTTFVNHALVFRKVSQLVAHAPTP